jgi:transglutaminase-like putative cysteine protease
MKMISGTLLVVWALAQTADENRFRLAISVQADEWSKAESPIEVWIPIPLDTDGQTVEELRLSKPLVMTRDPQTGNRFAHARWDSPTSASSVSLTCTVRRSAIQPRNPEQKPIFQPPAESLKHWLQLEAIDRIPEWDETVKKIVKEARNPLERGERIYDYVFERMAVDDSGSVFEIQSASKIHEAKKGNSTDFHVYFVALCQAAGLPARLESGLVMRNSSHRPGCWASFHAGPHGWVWVDVHAAKSRIGDAQTVSVEDRRLGFGRIPADRITLARGTRRALMPAAHQKIPLIGNPVAEHGGKSLLVKATWAVSSIKE